MAGAHAAGGSAAHHRGLLSRLGHWVWDAFKEQPVVPIKVRFTAAADYNRDGMLDPREAQRSLQVNTGVRIPMKDIDLEGRGAYAPATADQPALATVGYTTIESEYQRLAGVQRTDEIYDLSTTQA